MFNVVYQVFIHIDPKYIINIVKDKKQNRVDIYR